MKTKLLTIKRETREIFSVESNFPYWPNGAHIINRVAFDANGNLSAGLAQSIDADNGHGYLLLAPFGIRNTSVLEAARVLHAGETVTVEIA